MRVSQEPTATEAALFANSRLRNVGPGSVRKSLARPVMCLETATTAEVLATHHVAATATTVTVPATVTVGHF
ncbi:hypothetical protein [Streptomyces sp. NPDC054834]